MGDALKNLEELWELLANAIDAAGREREVLFLSKLALMLEMSCRMRSGCVNWSGALEDLS